MAIQNISISRLQQLMDRAKIGWWKADFHDKIYICSDYIIKLLGLDSEIISFEDFRQLIHAGYRNMITRNSLLSSRKRFMTKPFLFKPHMEKSGSIRSSEKRKPIPTVT